MVQIIRENRGPSIGEKFSNAFGAGLSMLQQHQEQKKQAQQLQQEDMAAQRLGVDISGIRDPKIRQEAISQALQGQRAEKLEMMKQQGKQGLAQEKQGFLEQLFSGRQQQGQQDSQEQPGMQGTQEIDPSMLSDAQIAQLSSMDPAMGRALMHAKDVAIREKRAEKEFQLKEKRLSPEFQREQQVQSSQAQGDVKYNQTLQESSKLNELKEKTLSRLEQLNKKGVTGKPYEKILEKIGLVNQTSEGRREFAADVKNLITDIRSILGAQFTGFEFQTILNAYPNADFSQEANAAIIKNLKEFQDIKKKEFEVASDLKKQNNGKIPVDFQSKVNDLVHEYAISRTPDIRKNTEEIMNAQYGIPKGHTLLLDPSGEPMSVPDNEVEQLIELGAERP